MASIIQCTLHTMVNRQLTLLCLVHVEGVKPQSDPYYFLSHLNLDGFKLSVQLVASSD